MRKYLSENFSFHLKNLIRVFFKSALVLFLIFVLLIALLYFPPIQSYLTKKVEVKLYESLETKIEIGGIHLNFAANLVVDNLIIQNPDGSDLLNVGSLDLEISVLKLLSKELRVRHIELQEMNGFLLIDKENSSTNLDFIVDKFKNEKKIDEPNTSDWKIIVDNIVIEQSSFLLNIQNSLKLYIDAGELSLQSKDMDLKNLHFDIKNISIRESFISLDILSDTLSNNLSVENSVNIVEELKRNIIAKVESLEAFDIAFSMKLDDDFILDTELKENQIENVYFNLLEKKISVDQMDMDDGFCKIILDSNYITDSISNTKSRFLEKFSWEIKSGITELNHFQFSFDNNFYPDTSTIFDANHFSLNEAEFSIAGALMASRKINARLNDLKFSERNGFVLEKFGAALTYNGEQLIGDNIIMKMPHSKIIGSIKLENEPIDNIRDQLSLVEFDIKLNEMDLHASDISSMVSDEILNKYDVSNIKSSNHIYGNLNYFNIEDLFLNIDEDIYGRITGSVKNLSNLKFLCLDLEADEIHISIDKAVAIIPFLYKYTKYLPPEIIIKSKVNGCWNDLSAKAIVESIYGNIDIEAEYKNSSEHQTDSLVIITAFQKLELGSVLADEKLGIVNLNNVTTIYGLENEDYDISTSGIVEDAILNNFQLSGIQYSARYYNDEGKVVIESYDSSLDFSIINRFRIQDSTILLTTEANLKNIDLYQLGISNDTFQLQSELNFESTFRKNFFNGVLELKAVQIKTHENFNVGDVNMSFLKDRDSIYFELESDVISGILNSNIPLGEIQDRLNNFYKPYFIKFDTTAHSNNKGILDFKFSFNKPNNNIVKLYTGLKELHFNEISGNLNESTNTSDIKISAPRLAYDNFSIDSVDLQISSTPEKLFYEINVNDLSYDNYHLRRLFMGGESKEGRVKNVITIKDTADSEFFRVGYIIDQTENRELVFNIDPDNLILNYYKWSVNDTSRIYLRNKNVNGNLNISKDDQSLFISVHNQLYDFKIKNFQLGSLENLFKEYQEDFRIEGLVDFDLDMKLDSLNPLINMNLKANDLLINGTQLGNIKAQMQNDRDRNISGDLILQNESNQIKIHSSYGIRKETTPLNVKIDVDLNDLQDFQSFANDLIKDPKGKLKGSVEILGNLKQFSSEGSLEFQDVSFYTTTLSSNYFLKNELIEVKSNQLLLKEFTVRDEEDNQFVINGSIFTPQFSTYDLDLNLKADQFTVFNKPEEESPNFFGSLIITNDVNIKGSYEAPDVKMTISFDAGTNLTYVLPPKEIDIISADGVVEFIGPASIDSVQELNLKTILTDTILTKYKGLDLMSEIIIDKNAVFTIEIDPLSGDFVTAKGNGKLTLIKDRDTEPVVSGSYEIEDGLYEVSFYGLVKKTFKFDKGGSLIWSGNPYNPLLNLNASYTVRTASTGLVSNEIYSLSEEEKSIYRKTLPYSVGINIGGEIQNPKLGFEIDLPEEDKSGFPLIETKLNRLNEPGHESELTKQVFGLLTIGSFIPESTGADGSTYGTALATTAAANSLNGILTNELNKLTGRYIKGADLDIGMQTYSEIQGSQQNMQTTMDIRFSKKLFNDRVEFEAKSSFDMYNDSPYKSSDSDYSNVHNDFAIIYDLRETGDLKLKAFDKSSYDIIYKDIRTSGLALIIIKEFNRYKGDKKIKRKSKKSRASK